MNLNRPLIVAGATVALAGFGATLAVASSDDGGLNDQRQAPVVEMVGSQPGPSQPDPFQPDPSQPDPSPESADSPGESPFDSADSPGESPFDSANSAGSAGSPG